MKAFLCFMLLVGLVMGATPSKPSVTAINSAVKSAVEMKVKKEKIGGKVSGVEAKVTETRPMQGWQNRYISTGTARIAIGKDFQVRSFTAVTECDGAKITGVDVSI